ncbi:hypothetical protein NQ315_015102 [Exocentrus adspersus]|uniref:PX domain-containing protein n=1 Tax=Exocentrus adspersus TaxID=1586481 RepID=A0AAV8VWM3_9CUCU|nr:hypothetical protein NQ315_015102 [Exocentrus adspersus]
MACFWFYQNEIKLEIPSSEDIGNVTFYKIQVHVSGIEWVVLHRYSEFYDLHYHLVLDHGVSKDILPSKKVIRNKCPEFIERRRKALEEYIQKIFVFLKQTMPKILVDFLCFNVYDSFFLLQDLSSRCFLEADIVLSTNKSYYFSTLEVFNSKAFQLHAISQFLKKTQPLLNNAESRFDMSPVLDLCSQLNVLRVQGSSGTYLKSNIILNKLSFELSAFKNLNILYINNVLFDIIFSLGNIRDTLLELHVANTNTTKVCQILQCDVIHKYNLESSQKWTALEVLDLSNNNLTEIDTTITLVPNLKKLILNDNKISTISNLSSLSNLSYLSLSNNLITICNDLHLKLGNILTLNLSQNNIVTCKGFSKLYSLENLDLSSNKITEIDEIKHIGGLPCLENFILTGNSVAATVDYRIKVLEFFKERAKFICLDNEKPSQAELDKVSVLQALSIIKEGKTPKLTVNTAN